MLDKHHHYSPELTAPRHSRAFPLLQRIPSYSCMAERVWVMLVCAMRSVCVHLAVVGYTQLRLVYIDLDDSIGYLDTNERLD